MHEIHLKSEWNSNKNFGDILKFTSNSPKNYLIHLKIASNSLEDCVNIFKKLSEILLKVEWNSL